MTDFIGHIQTHFLHFLPLLVAAGFAILISIERAYQLFVRFPLNNTNAFFQAIRDMVLSNRLHHAIAHCEKYRHKPVSRVVKEALLRAHQPDTVIENGLDIAVSEAVQTVQRRTNYLSSLANIATLLGLIGTILGLVAAFGGLEGDISAQERATRLATGISTALFATMTGIAVAVVCMVAFSILMNRTTKITAEIEQGAYRALDILKQRLYSSDDAGNGDVRRTG